MKKIILIILLLLLKDSVYASTTYYSPYSDLLDYSETEVIGSDLVKVEKKISYRWYKTEKRKGDYYIEGENDLNFPFIDKTDYRLSDFSEWSIEEPLKLPNRLILKRNIYEYKDILKVRYIYISNVEGSYEYFNIPELTIYIDNQKIDYDFFCEECNDDFGDYINNRVYFENRSKLRNRSSLMIDLKGYYDFNSLMIEMHLYDETTKDKKFKISVSREKENGLIYAENSFVYNFRNKSYFDIRSFSFTHEDLILKNPEYGEPIVSEDRPELIANRIINEREGYRYKDFFYCYYNIINNYMDGYSEVRNDEYPLKGEEVTLYKSQVRDKVVIKKDLIIDDKDMNLKDFILESTIDDIKITSNLNKKINGIYKVNYILPFETITKDITVDIQQNTIDALNYKINENQTLKKQINNLNTIINNQYIDIKEIIKDKEKISENFNNKILKLELKNKELSKNKKNLNNTFVIKKNNVLNKKLLFIYLILLLVITFMLKIKYRLKK